MITTSGHSLSVRASLIASMALMLFPLLLSAIGGYLILNQTVIADYQDIAYREHNQLVPLHNLQINILQSETRLEEYVITGNAEKLRDYRFLQQEIEVGFTHIAVQLDSDKELALLLGTARTDWSDLESIVTDLLAARDVQDQIKIPEALSRVNSLHAGAHDKLAAIYSLIEEKLDQDYADADLGFERSEWIAGISITISLALMLTGIHLINHSLLTNIQKLVDGARRFSEGDREHKIEVQVPPELKKVAEEFNRMILIIRTSEDNLIDQANRDKLTGLLNRRAYDDAMTDAYQRLQRNGEIMALVALDVDHFKKVNDTYGHDAGDEVLKQIAAAILSLVRNIDKVFRIGGEEFSILLPGTDKLAAGITAERIRKAVEALDINTTQGNIKVTMSLGFALGFNIRHTPEFLKESADIALYQAKAAGRNTVIAADNQ